MSTDREFLLACNSEMPVDAPPALISEYIHLRRVLPSGNPMPGPFDVGYTPYFVEVMDAMGPYSGVRIVSVMKGVQIGATANCAENVIAYYMDANPAEIIYASATDALLGKWVKRLEPLIDSCGYRHKITDQSNNPKSRKSGDTTYSKEYAGGSLSMGSLQSPASLRSESNRIIFADEIDGAPPKTTSGEGSPLSILHGRAAAFGSRGKVMEFSTPSTIERSVINGRYLSGDQRRYYVPCPFCAEMQTLEFERLQPEYLGEMLDSVSYECAKCKRLIGNHQKTRMLSRGEWRPTAVPRTRGHRSYHISTLYSPVGMMSWTAVYQKYLDAQDDPDQLPSFVNLYLGKPYKEEGSRPDIKRVISLRGDYENGVVPPGVLYLTVGADVQRGKEQFQKMSGDDLERRIAKMRASGANLWKAGLPRIEIEVLGIGSAYRSWSVDYRVFYGHTTEGPFAGAFEAMYEWAEKTGMRYRRRDGMEFAPQMVLMDAADGETRPAVMAFCERFGPNTYPVQGIDWLRAKQDPGIDRETNRNIDRYRLSRKSKDSTSVYVQASTNHYKATLYSRLKVARKQTGTQPPALCEFPRDRPDHYFAMLTAEEMRPNGSFHNGGRPAEALDCRVYALCAADLWLDMKIQKQREAMRKKNVREDLIQLVEPKKVLQLIENELAARAKTSTTA